MSQSKIVNSIKAAVGISAMPWKSGRGGEVSPSRESQQPIRNAAARLTVSDINAASHGLDLSSIGNIVVVDITIERDGSTTVVMELQKVYGTASGLGLGRTRKFHAFNGDATLTMTAMWDGSKFQHLDIELPR